MGISHQHGIQRPQAPPRLDPPRINALTPPTPRKDHPMLDRIVTKNYYLSSTGGGIYLLGGLLVISFAICLVLLEIEKSRPDIKLAHFVAVFIPFGVVAAVLALLSIPSFPCEKTTCSPFGAQLNPVTHTVTAHVDAEAYKKTPTEYQLPPEFDEETNTFVYSVRLPIEHTDTLDNDWWRLWNVEVFSVPKNIQDSILHGSA